VNGRCTTCGNQWGHDTAGLNRCQEMHARAVRIDQATDLAAQRTPTTPLTRHQGFDLYAHLRTLGITDQQAEDALQRVLDLGWRPAIHGDDYHAPEPVTNAEPVVQALIGGEQLDALAELGSLA
jgi:hypothetical protein